jgi:hypothetical protein
MIACKRSGAVHEVKQSPDWQNPVSVSSIGTFKDHLTVSQFRELFGRHTFFLDDRGLNVLELLEVPGMEVEEGEMVRLADWSDMGFTRLTTHPPEPTGIVVCLKEVRH